MTEHERDDVRALFRGVDLEDVPSTRDLIGPAVAWGDGRRRRDRWAAAGVTGAVAAVAVAGVVALRPGGGGPGSVAPGRAAISSSSKPAAPPTTAIQPVLPPLFGTIRQRQQELLDSLDPYLPAGVRIACRHFGNDDNLCTSLILTGPAGTNNGQWVPGSHNYQPPPAGAKYDHPHTATAAIPLVSGTVQVPGGAVLVTSTDTEAQQPLSDKTMVTNPTALTFHTAVYEFIPSGIAPAFSMQLTELVRDMPWKPGAEVPDSHALWGFDQNGPLLSPQQFGTLATSPTFGMVCQQLADLNLEAEATSSGVPSTPPSTSSR
jgi:hypothetical protein